jgi:hypothetical protein
VRRRVQAIERQLWERERLEDALVVARADLPSAEEHDGPSSGPFIMGGIGLVSVATGAVLGALALAQERGAEGESVGLRAYEELSAGEDLALGANIAFVAGGAALLGGLVWWLLDEASDSEPSSVVLGPGTARLRIAF